MYPLPLALACVAAWVGAALAAPDPVRIGVLEDMSGVYPSSSGSGSYDAARMAVQGFGGAVLGRPIGVLQGDHQNKADVGIALARH